MRKKIFLALLSLAIITVTVVFIITNKKSTLNIYVVPNDAVVLVDNKNVGQGHVTLSVTNGNHQIRATCDGYNTYNGNLQVNGDAIQNIALTQSTTQQASAVKINPNAAVAFQPVTSDTLIAIDSKSSYLIKIGKDGITTLLSKPVYVFSFVNPYVVVIEKSRDKIDVVNIDNGSIKSFDAKNYTPIISISLNSDANSFYFLGNYDPTTRNSTLFSNPINNLFPQNEGVFVADDIKSLTDNKILLTLSADAEDSSNFSVYDIPNKKYLYQITGNGTLISPSYKNLAVFSSGSLVNINLNDFDKKSYDFTFTNQKVIWANDNTLIVLTNEMPGVKYHKINVSLNSQTSDSELTKFNQTSIRFVIGVIDNILFVQDSEGKIWSVNIS